MCIQNIIEDKLNQELKPYYLEVVNESHLHNVTPGTESHFKLIVVSQTFDGMRLLARHRVINQLLKQELKNHIDAVFMHTYTKSEWQHLFGGVSSSAAFYSGSRSVA